MTATKKNKKIIHKTIQMKRREKRTNNVMNIYVGTGDANFTK